MLIRVPSRCSRAYILRITRSRCANFKISSAIDRNIKIPDL